MLASQGRFCGQKGKTDDKVVGMGVACCLFGSSDVKRDIAIV